MHRVFVLRVLTKDKWSVAVCVVRQVCAKFFRDVVIVALHGGIASGHQINISFRVLLGGVFTVLSAIMLLCLLGCCQRSAHTLTVSSPWGLPVFIVWYGKCPGVSQTR